MSNFKHGYKGTSVYTAWVEMVRRCYNPNFKDYRRYGGRGIAVCAEWRLSFENFLKDMGEKPNGLTLGRIDNDGDYCKDNCRWESIEDQNRNKSNCRLMEFNGVTKTLSEWSRDIGIPYTTLQMRIKCGWDTDRILSTPKRKYNAKY